VSVGTTPLRYRGGTLDIEYAWLGRERRGAPLVVFLHEGLGSVSAWRQFPAHLCSAGGFRGVVYSRSGYGRSTPRRPGERWTPSFMHEEAQELLPALLAALDIDAETDPPWLLGHSDGGSIALIFAATHPALVAGLVVLAPHIFVEEISIASIQATRVAYLETSLRDKLGRHHADPDSAFWGWNDVWLDPAFRGWSIEALLPGIRCPVLAVQGRDDPYGTLAQVEGIARAVPGTELVVLDACGHAVHRDQPDRLTRATIDFVARHHQSNGKGTTSWTASPS
jgi:pimeloyl-ACP methyl ester carboxylesterase